MRHADDQDYAEIFQGADGEFYYRIKASNHEIIAESEGHKNKHDAVDVVALHFPAAAYNLVDLTEDQP